MILVVNLNLAIDYLIEVAGLRIGKVHRARSTRRRAGGKGVNVARVLGAFGERVVIAGFLGGRAGDLIAEELGGERIEFSATRIRRESRTCVILDDPGRGQTVINELGPVISRKEATLFSAGYNELLTNAELVLITGSLPPGLPRDFYADLIRAAGRREKPILLDSSGVALAPAIGAQPSIVKINQAEAAELLARPVDNETDAAQAVDELIAAGARHAMVTLGDCGAVLAYNGVKYLLVPPRIGVAGNSVGSGDAAMAGLAIGWRRSCSGAEMGTLAVAAGAANALCGGGGSGSAEETARLFTQVSCTILER